MGTYTYVGSPAFATADLPGRHQSPAQDAPARRPPREPLSGAATSLLKALPADAAIPGTARDFPHVLNRIAEVWSDARAFGRLIDGLLIDDRPNRDGFPASVILELDALRQHRMRLLRSYGP